MKLLRKILIGKQQERVAVHTDAPNNRVGKMALALVCLSLLASLIWIVSSLAGSSHASSRSISQISPKLQAGVGSEVFFASNNPPLDRVRDSIGSIASFIAKRSGLTIDDETKTKLTSLEAGTRDGSIPPISTRRYVNALSETLAARIANLTDQEIDYAATTLKRNVGIKLRADGRFGMCDNEFYEEARELRTLAANNQNATVTLVRVALKDEVTNRISALQNGVPGHFAGADTAGLSPVQTVLVTYSVLADDELAFGSRDLNQFAARLEFQRRIYQAEGQQQKAKLPPTSGSVTKAYGPEGRLFAAPVDLIFNKVTLNSLLDRLSKGGD